MSCLVNRKASRHNAKWSAGQDYIDKLYIIKPAKAQCMHAQKMNEVRDRFIQAVIASLGWSATESVKWHW